jgi:hypothetical protein
MSDSSVEKYVFATHWLNCLQSHIDLEFRQVWGPEYCLRVQGVLSDTADAVSIVVDMAGGYVDGKLVVVVADPDG